MQIMSGHVLSGDQGRSLTKYKKKRDTYIIKFILMHMLLQTRRLIG